MLGGGLLVASLIAIYIVVIWVIINETENGDGKVGLLALRNSPRRRGKSPAAKPAGDRPEHQAQQITGKPTRVKSAATPGYLKARPRQHP